MSYVNNSGMPLWETLLPLGLFLALIILAAAGVGIVLADILGGRRK